MSGPNDGAENLANKRIKNSTLAQGNKNEVTYYKVDGAIDPTAGVAVLNKGSAGAYTLAAPTAAQEGMKLVITSASAFAHVVTATGLLNDGVTGGGKNAGTFGAFVGASIELIAVGLAWNVMNLKVVTVA